MDSKLWPQVKIGDYLIFADQWEGVFKILVKDVDIRIYDADVPGNWSYPYGLTKDTGTVKVRMDSEERVMNLADLFKWSPSNYDSLLRAWEAYQTAQVEVDKQKTAYLSLVTSLK
jgi:hypothetical protein